MKKITVAVTGASGSIYAGLLLKKLLESKEHWDELALVMTNNAREVWKIELGNEEYKSLPVRVYETTD
ncbi:MAG TPA: flavoprotein, partial [Ferruginibacter sp.]|nr:flavoprotein [Ferruginibacter sp.]